MVEFYSKDTSAPPLPAPQPEDFGLTPQETQLFSSFMPPDVSFETVMKFGAGMGLLFSLVVPFWTGRTGDLEFWICCLIVGPIAGSVLVLAPPFSVVGLTLEYAIRKIRALRRQKSTRNHPKYPSYLLYQEAYRTYSESLVTVSRAERQKEMARQQEMRSTVDWWKSLDGKSFERELVQLFKKRGFEVQWTGRSGADGGVDILLKANGRKIIVQCKAHKDYVGPGPVRDLYGTLTHKKADEAWLITTSGFYSGAASFASGKPIRLLTIRQILAGNEFSLGSSILGSDMSATG